MGIGFKLAMPGDHQRNNEIFSELELVLRSLLGDAHISFTPLVYNLIFRLFMLVKSMSTDRKIKSIIKIGIFRKGPFNRAPICCLFVVNVKWCH